MQRQRTLLRESSIHHFFKKDEILNLATLQQAFDTSIQQLRLHTMNAITIIYNHTTEMITKVLKEIAAQTKKLQEV